ncbi:serine/threonine-protein kinase EDR1-like isoform X2 [Papaver somniferum]|uniref:serine/threonine-protein kinase EDR1-like isoform X2 n=1 Tax=Papaver somniferum TaxID=3469 RepID=UPI000E6FB32A|nr:serine/threonine-protein kinase EDR1-like isoform X2 [Papaver somniferum]
MWLKTRTSHESTKKYDNHGGHNSCFGYQKTILSDHTVHASADDKDTHKAGSYNMIAYKLKGISWVWEHKHNQVPDTKLFGGSKASSSFSYNFNYNRPSSLGSRSGTSITSSSSSSSSSHCLKLSTGDSLNYDISWEDLTFCEQIRRGSCATVCHGLWCVSDVAVKMYFNFEYSDDLLRSFRQEVSLMKRLRHPNVLLFMGAVTSLRRLGIVTEFLPRGSLFKLLQRETPTLDWKRRVLMALDIARGMNYLHSYDPPIVHRDLKSSNLLVDKDWTVKVGDFGLSPLKHTTFLSTNSGKGTWMAPEVIRNEPANGKADVYSFGVILWELATSKIPWADLKPMQRGGAPPAIKDTFTTVIFTECVASNLEFLNSRYCNKFLSSLDRHEKLQVHIFKTR